jgi:hypothetical protein
VLRVTFDMLCLPVIPAAIRNNSLAHENKTVLQVICRSLPRFRSRKCCEPVKARNPSGIDAAVTHLVIRLRELSNTSRKELEALLMDAHAKLQLVPPVSAFQGS